MHAMNPDAAPIEGDTLLTTDVEGEPSATGRWTIRHPALGPVNDLIYCAVITLEGRFASESNKEGAKATASGSIP